ncbi:MAG: thioredoxin domain-containing protein [Myxococcota bacterium]
MHTRVGRALLALVAGMTLSQGSAAAAALPGAPAFPPELQAHLDAALASSSTRENPRTRHRTAEGGPLYTNRLILEQSPYLLQHAHNPVNWYPWGDEAFETARRLGRPVLLSVGYSTCHWCHVMEEKCFEDPTIAEYLNRHYIAIKVDREERPDVDEVYMTAVQALTRSGGWPMTVWLNPDRKPFYGGTYFPPEPAHGRPGFLEVLERLHDVYREQPEKIHERAETIAELIRSALAPEPSVGVPGSAQLQKALAEYRRRFDSEHGGVRSRTKFPSSLPIGLLLRAHRRTGDGDLLDMALQTLDAMRRGGIHDHIAGGFHRYTTEPSWTVPHFEKMLYDNALLAVSYLEAYQTTGDTKWADVVHDILFYVMREMTAPEGSFYSATDADSDGEEGLFFIWTRDELRKTLGPELGKLSIAAYGLDGPPSFEGTHWVLRRDRSLAELARLLDQDPSQVARRLAAAREKLREARARRVPPLLDDKQLVSWNGLMIQAFVRAGLALREPRYVAHGAAAARALLERARPEGRLARYLRGGTAHGRGLLDDHAFLEAGLLDLFEATGDRTWLEAALALQRELDREFFDDMNGGYWVSPGDFENLLVREKPVQDGALPSGNAYAVMNLLRLYTLTLDEELRVHAEMTLRAFSDLIERAPTGLSRMLDALDFMLDRPKEILIVTPSGRDGAEPFLREFGRVYLPNRVVVVAPEPELPALEPHVPWVEGKKALSGSVTAYVCEERVCDLPARDTKLFARQLRKKARPYPGSTATALRP